MNNEKGKRRIKDDETIENPANSEHDYRASNSIAGRLTASAAGLINSALNAPSSSELSNQASAAFSSSGKTPQAGESHSSAWAESSKSFKQSTLSALPGQPPSSFRAGHSAEHAQDAEAEFSSFLNGIDTFKSSLELYSEPVFKPQFKTATSLAGIHLTAGTGYVQDEWTAYHSVDEQQRHDGSDVLAILSTPSAMSEEELLQIEDENINWHLTEQQISKLQAIIGELFPPIDFHVPQQLDQAMNLIPPMVSTSAISMPNNITAVDEDAILYFGSNVTRETAKQTWMSQWESVLRRYTDEVWGNLLPLVAEARKEIEILKEGPVNACSELPTALKRLQLVLNHFRKS